MLYWLNSHFRDVEWLIPSFMIFSCHGYLLRVFQCCRWWCWSIFPTKFNSSDLIFGAWNDQKTGWGRLLTNWDSQDQAIKITNKTASTKQKSVENWASGVQMTPNWPPGVKMNETEISQWISIRFQFRWCHSDRNLKVSFNSKKHGQKNFERFSKKS